MGQMLSKLKNITALVVAVNSVMAFVVYYYVALNTGVKLKELYFLGVTVNFSLLFGLLFTILGNKWVRAIVLGCSAFFMGVSVTYVLDWVGNDVPKMNHVYECLMFGIGISLLITLYRYGSSINVRKLFRMDN